MPTLVDEHEAAPHLPLWQRPQTRAALHKGLALVDQAVISATSFVATLLVGRAGGPDELGVYSLGFTILLVAHCLQDALVGGPYTVFGVRLDAHGRAQLAASALLQQLFWGGVVSAAL